MKIRGRDGWGEGHFGASRGNRTHNGVDIIIQPGADVKSINQGIVTKHGYCYASDAKFRYVEVTDDAGARWRYFYVLPGCEIADKIEWGDVLGTSQDLTKRYPGITPHLHLEIITKEGRYLDPTGIIRDL